MIRTEKVSPYRNTNKTLSLKIMIRLEMLSIYKVEYHDNHQLSHL